MSQPNNQGNTLPTPPNELIPYHEQCVAWLKAQIDASADNCITFFDFMQGALYAPGCGYYNNPSAKFGEHGDFTTAPELSALFSHCLAKQCKQVLSELTEPCILECGGGSGQMAFDMLTYLAHHNALPQHYFILELSATLKDRQQEKLNELPADIRRRITWLSCLPEEPFNGVIVANEVLDAMPVRRFMLNDDSNAECCVGFEDNRFVWRERELDLSNEPDLEATLTSLPRPYLSEWNPQLAPWLASMGNILTRGAILLIDYGFPHATYYHPSRREGTLMCHYQHYAHDNPLILAGLQDITAHVDFTTIAHEGFKLGLSPLGYTTQAHFLLSMGLLSMVESDLSVVENYETMQAIKRLLLPSEMGELFAIIALGKNYTDDLQGFEMRNTLDTLTSFESCYE